MNEELKIKVKVDTSSITTTLNKLKNEVSNVEKTMNGTASSSASASQSTQANVKATKQLGSALAGIQTKLQGLQGMTIGDIAGSLIGLTAIQKTVSGIKSYMTDIKAIKLADKAGDWLSANMPTKGKGFTVIDKTLNDTRGKVSEIVQEITNTLENGDAFPKGRVEELSKSLNKLGVSTKGTAPGLKGLVSAVKAVGVAAAAATVAVGALLVLLPVFAIGVAAALKVSKLGDAIYHTAKRFNMSTDAFQEWSYIMEMSGGTVEDLTGFMETLASEQAAVIEGSEDAAKTFERLGLSMEEVSGMRQQELFTETVKRIQQIGDATERSAIAYSLFGDEASKFMNVLNMSNAEMDKVIENYHLLGGAMSGELVAKSNSLQGSIHNMKQAWSGLGNTIAQVFIPIVQAVVRWLTKAFVVVNLFLKSIFGLDLKGATSGAMDSAASSTNKYTASTKKATKAAEELKRITMGFDELNILSNPKSSSADSSAGAAAPSMGGGMEGLDTSLLDASSLGLEGIYAWFDKYKGAIRDITAVVLTAVGLVGGLAALFTGNFLLAGALLAIGGIGIALGASDGGVWDKLANKLKAVWDKLAPMFQPVIDFFKGAWEDIRVMFAEAWDFIKDIWSHVAPFFQVMLEVIKQRFYDFQMTLEIIWGVIVEAVRFVIVAVAAYWELCWTKIKAVWNVVIGYFKAIWDTIKGIFSVVGDVLTGNWKGAWEGIKGIVNTWVGFFKRVWQSIKDVFSGVKTFFNDIFKGAFNGVLGIVEKALNAIIKRANKLSWDIPDWVPVIGGGKFGFNFKEVSIPRLATGGIATASTIANIGENGREAILPLDNNTEWMDALANKIAERNAGPSKIVLQVGEKELGWAAINGINGITKQTGNIQLAL